MINYPFSPTGNTVKQAAVPGTAAVNFVTTWPQGGGNVRVANKSANNVGYVAFGPSTIGVATTTGVPILPGTVELFTVGDKQTYAALISASGATATMFFTPGQGGI